MISRNTWLTVDEVADDWGISPRRVRALCEAGQIFQAKKIGRQWLISPKVPKPADGRTRRFADIPNRQKQLCAHVETRRKQVVGYFRRHPASARECAENERHFLIGAAYHMHTERRGTLSIEDVGKIYDDEAIPRKPLSEQLAIVRFFAAMRYIRRLHGKRTRLEPKLVRVFNALIVSGCPNAAPVFADASLADFYNRRIAIALNTFRRSNKFISFRLAELMLEFLDLAPFAAGNYQTTYLLACFILMESGYPPVMMYRSRIQFEHENFRKYKNILIPSRTICVGILRAFNDWPALTPT